jgi:hypothetical protein
MDQLDTIAEVRRYHVVQEETYSVQVKFETTAIDDAFIERRVRDSLKPILPRDAVIEVCRVERIDAPAAAKRSFVQSRVSRALA